MAKLGKALRRKAAEPSIAVDQRVRVHVDGDVESRGLVVEDFGEMAGQPVDLGGTRIADAARRWAVLLDDGTLLFVDDHQVTAE